MNNRKNQSYAITTIFLCMWCFSRNTINYYLFYTFFTILFYAYVQCSHVTLDQFVIIIIFFSYIFGVFFQFTCLDFPSRPTSKIVQVFAKKRHVWTCLMSVSVSLNFQKSGLWTFPTKKFYVKWLQIACNNSCNSSCCAKITCIKLFINLMMWHQLNQIS